MILQACILLFPYDRNDRKYVFFMKWGPVVPQFPDFNVRLGLGDRTYPGQTPWGVPGGSKPWFLMVFRSSILSYHHQKSPGRFYMVQNRSKLAKNRYFGVSGGSQKWGAIACTYFLRPLQSRVCKFVNCANSAILINFRPPKHQKIDMSNFWHWQNLSIWQKWPFLRFYGCFHWSSQSM